MNNLYLRTIRLMLVSAIAFLAFLFIPAGTFHYWRGWVFWGTFMVLSVLVYGWMAIYDKELLERRLRAGPSAEKTREQKTLTAIGGPVVIVAFVMMVFDHRFGWSPAVPDWLSLVGDVLGVVGMLMYFIVIRENRFASSTVEVSQGQSVISTGPYSVVRHPMYAGAILFFIGAPLALGSWWGLVFLPLFVAAFAWRCLNEEKFLCANLPGYPEYMRKVRYRLVPYVW
ncbi:MAG TPA: isoprenylcysteine carboxylmethyltransferase family protein [Bryobacteraceae bacterium]|nr:isoprenylcysteine carboxylmethyltransferase family protein [Bryobacteraceae bacterium]